MRRVWRSRSRSRVSYPRARISRGRSREQWREATGRSHDVTAGMGRGDGNFWPRSENRNAISGSFDCDFRRALTGVQRRRDPVVERQGRWEYDGDWRLGRQGEAKIPVNPEFPKWNRSEGRGHQRASEWRNSGADGFWSGNHQADGQATVLIRNLSWTVSPERLRYIFEQFGPVVDAYLPRNFQTGIRKGFGFVKFKYMEDAGEAKDYMNQKVVGGREIQVVVIKDHRVSTPGNYVSNDRGRLESRIDNRGINQSHPHLPLTAGRFVRQESNRSPQITIEYDRENGADEEGWTMVGRQQGSNIRRSAKGGYRGQNDIVEFGGRGRVMPGTQMQKGVCFKCLGRGHFKDECRDPIVCRKCQRVGHYEAACQLGAAERDTRISKEYWVRHMGMEHDLPRVACLVSEIVEGEVEEEEICKAVKAKYPHLAGSQVKKLVNNELLIRQISPADCIKLCGGQQVIGKAKIQWKRIIWTTKIREVVTRPAIIDVRGIPAAFRSEKNMEAIVKPFGRLRGIITTGLESGDPHLTVLDVEMEKEEGTLRPIIIQGRKGMVTLKVSERQPPAPPAEGDCGRVGGKAAGRGDEPGNGEEAMAAVGGNVIGNGLGADKRDGSRREKGESSRGSANPTESVVVSKIRRAKKPQGGKEGGQPLDRLDCRARGL